jgi:hypothetical protein
MTYSSLVVVGSSIKFISHLTTEAKTYIEQSNKVLYLVNEPAIKEWVAPIQKPKYDKKMLSALGIELSDLSVKQE